MPNVNKGQFLNTLKERFGALHKMSGSQSLFRLGDPNLQVFLSMAMYWTGMNVSPKEKFMVKLNPSKTVYIVIDVMRGVVVGAHSFLRLKDARTYLKWLRKGRNLDVDDVQLFESALNPSTRQHNVDEESCVQLSR